MARLLRIIARLLLLAFAGAVVYGVVTRRTAATGPAPTTFTPTPDRPPARPTETPTPEAKAAASNLTWVAPVDGACPDGYPIKGNANSRIFHVPGGRFYDRTVPERCYATEAAAEADGYRRAKA